MARLIISDDFTSQLTLLNNIVVKYDSFINGTNPLTAFLTQQEIDLTDDATAGENAATHNTSRALLSRQSENFRQLRDARFNVVWKHINGSVQFLKSFYKNNTGQLGNWGVTVTESGKINYPAPFADRATLATIFIAKHNSYPAGESPLQPYLTQQQIDIAKDAGW